MLSAQNDLNKKRNPSNCPIKNILKQDEQDIQVTNENCKFVINLRICFFSRKRKFLYMNFSQKDL